VKVVEGLGCKAIRVETEDQLAPALAQAEAWIAEFKVPVVVEVILERVTNMAMGTEIDKINELEPLAMSIEDAPVAVLQS
jgi:tartronate-semialdehyde synthase